MGLHDSNPKFECRSFHEDSFITSPLINTLSYGDVHLENFQLQSWLPTRTHPCAFVPGVVLSGGGIVYFHFATVCVPVAARVLELKKVDVTRTTV